MMPKPKAKRRYRFKVTVGKPDDPMNIPAGTIAVEDEHVPAAVDGAGDHNEDCMVLVLPDGRRWSHPTGPRPVARKAFMEHPDVTAANPPPQGHDLSGHHFDDILELVK